MTDKNTITLGELVEVLNDMLKEHPEAANKTVVTPMDEEGNEFHALLPSVVIEPVYISMCLDTACHPDWIRYDNCVILG